MICPAANGSEAAWAGPQLDIIAAPDLMALIAHFRGERMLTRPTAQPVATEATPYDLRDVKGQETAKRALEVPPRVGTRC